MKITIFIGSLAGGGAERVACELASWLNLRGHDVILLTVTSTTENYPINPNVKQKTIDLQYRIPFSLLRQFVKLLRLGFHVKRSAADCFVAFLPNTIRALMLLRNFVKAPIIISERVDPSSYVLKTQEQIIKDAQKVDGIVFQTEQAQQYYKENGVDVSHSVVIPNAINREFIRDSFTGVRRKVIVSVGRLTAQKNYSLLIRAFAAVSNDFPDYCLTIYGTGGLLEELKALARSLDIGDRVQFPGYVTHIGEHIREASLFVLSSDYEGMPNALMEAMALGIPCISTQCKGGGAEFLIQHEVNGLLVPINDEKSLAHEIRRILSDETLAKTLGENGRMICQRLDADDIYDQWEQYILHTLLKKRTIQGGKT